MALIIYGSPRSRTLRTLWAAAELGLTYEHVPLAWDDPVLKSPDFLRLNPVGSIPTVVDDGFALSESMAINLYLGKKYGSLGAPPLYPDSPEGEAEVWRWSLWAQGHLEPWIQRDAKLTTLRLAVGDAAEPLVQAALAALDRALSARAWLVGDHFTIGDLNVAGVLSPSRAEHAQLQDHPHVGAWLARCYGRPAARATRQRFAA
jgi:glutathione S-transferase